MAPSNTDHEGVSRILSQATDLVVLEQTAALNLAGVVSNSDLEARFRRLKAQSSSPKSLPTKPNAKAKTPSNFRGKVTVTGSSHRNPDPELFGRSIPNSRLPPPSSSTNRSSESNNNRSRSGEEINKNEGIGTPRDFGNDPRLASRSPPKTTGCLWWCTKQTPKSKSNRDRGRRKDDEFDWESTEEALKDLGSLSVKEQREVLRKAMEQQRKISKEAVKIVKLAKPAKTDSRS